MRIYIGFLKIFAMLYNRIVENIRVRTVLVYQRAMFKKCGKNVSIAKGCKFTYDHIELGNNIRISENASFIAAISTIHIADNVIFGPHVTIRGGDHRIDMIGRTLRSVTNEEKLPENDVDVYIEEDVWIGCNVTILKGVRIGKGSVIGAGSVVVKNVPPYTVHVGVHPPYEKARFTNEQIQEHERLLYGN